MVTKQVRIALCIAIFTACIAAHAQLPVKIAKLKYDSGGDWYANKACLPNLIKFANRKWGLPLLLRKILLRLGRDLFLYPYVYMTPWQRGLFPAANLRKYLIWRLLHVDDNYGLDKFIRLELKKVFPELELIELPFDHPIYHQKFDFPNGLPKIHEHDAKPPQGFGLVYEGRLVVFYTYECDLGNGWEDQRIHNDPEEKRQQALRMGANILTYCFTNSF
jgi:hypothetical protein